MSEAAQGVLILIAVALVFAVLAHLRIREFVTATVVSGLAATVLFLMLDTIRHGYVDKFALIALVVGTFWASLVSALVGAVVRILRKRNRTPSGG
jgi:hypothetical protein